MKSESLQSSEELGGLHTTTSSATAPTDLPKKTNDTLFTQIPAYIHAILNSSNSRFARLECPQPDVHRYAYLGQPPNHSEASQRPRFFFAHDLNQCVNILPRLLGSIVETTTFLGPENFVLLLWKADPTMALSKSLKSFVAAYERS